MIVTHIWSARASDPRSVSTLPDTPTLFPLYASVSAGFPSPADDYLEEHLDIGDYLVDNPTATFFIRVAGDSMIGAHITPDSLLVVDRSRTPHHGDIIIAALNGEFTCKRYWREWNQPPLLVAENPHYPPIEVREGDEFIAWGVVVHILQQPVRKV